MEKFFVGIHRVGVAWKFDRAFISANRLADTTFTVMGADEWVMDSGAFTAIMKHGRYRLPASEYAAVIRRFSDDKGLLAAVAQDYMCEDLALKATGLTIAEHQRLTIERYDALMACDVGGVYIMPVIQGFAPEDYARHVRDYGDRLAPGAWVGVGSVCKRQGDPEAIVAVLEAILAVRPDLRLHGFGVKLTALRDPRVVEMLYSADSMAWSFAARKRKGDSNSLSVARQFELDVLQAISQQPGFNLRTWGKRAATWAAEDNANARARRETRARWNASWRVMKARADEEDRRNLDRASRLTVAAE
jgi:hypothetical protein